MAPETILHSGM